MGEEKPKLNEKDLYDPLKARSDITIFDNMVFKEPWSQKTAPPLPEEIKPSEEGDPSHGK